MTQGRFPWLLEIVYNFLWEPWWVHTLRAHFAKRTMNRTMDFLKELGFRV